VSLNNTLLTGSSGNPNLKPITSSNLDGSLAWYFSKRGYVSGSVFKQSMQNYVKTGLSQVEFFNTSTNTNSVYAVTSRYGVDASLKGFEMAAEVPIGAGFGASVNYTNVDAKDADGQTLLGTSRHTYNAVGYFENDTFSVRMAYNHRSDYPIAFLGNGTTVGPGNGVRYYKGSGTLSASFAYKISQNLSVTLDGNNLNNPIRNTYEIATYSPGQWHQSGRQFFLSLRGKM
jgi:iron complex outermembrane receptor protein